MITYKSGNIFEDVAEALVNPVNCMGVDRAGLALEFRNRYPNNHNKYVLACDLGKLQLGKVLTYDSNTPGPHRYIINFPTKNHWRNSTQITSIRAGLQALVLEINRLEIKSIAIPALGTGLGGLPWNVFRVEAEAGLVHVSIPISVYLPHVPQ